MGKRNLTTQTMVKISEGMVDPERDKPILERYPLTGALLPLLLQAHTNLIRLHRESLQSQGAIAEIQKEQAALDAIHDRKIRGVHGLLSSLAEVSDDADKARHYLGLRDRLLPDGLRAVQRSYLDQSGEVVLLQDRLDDATKQALLEIQTPEGSAFDHVQAWIGAGKRLGALEVKRLEITKKAGETDTRKSDVRDARFEWIRTMNALETTLEMDRARPEDVEQVFRQLHAALSKTNRRGPSTPAQGEGESPLVDANSADAGLSDTPPAPSSVSEACDDAPMSEPGAG